MSKKKKTLTYEDYLAKIPKSWKEPLREIHAIRWMHYDQERKKKLPLDKQVLADQKEMEQTIKQLGVKYKALIGTCAIWLTSSSNDKSTASTSPKVTPKLT